MSNLRLPQSEGGTLAYKSCGECPYKTRLVRNDVQWVINWLSLRLQQFRRNLAAVMDRINSPVMVLHHLESDRVTRVSVHTVNQTYN